MARSRDNLPNPQQSDNDNAGDYVPQTCRPSVTCFDMFNFGGDQQGNQNEQGNQLVIADTLAPAEAKKPLSLRPNLNAQLVVGARRRRPRRCCARHGGRAG
jgi:hypothetical protein